MKMKSQNFVSSNVTMVFRKIDHDSLDYVGLVKKLQDTIGSVPEVVSLKNPVQYHVYSFDNQKILITVEDNRLIIEDRSSHPLESTILSKLPADLLNIFFSSFDLTAYGLNYIVRGEFEDGMDFDRQAKKILAGDFIDRVKLLGVDVGVQFASDDVKYQVQTKKLSDAVMGITMNAHYERNNLPDEEGMRGEISSNLDELSKFTEALL